MPKHNHDRAVVPGRSLSLSLKQESSLDFCTASHLPVPWPAGMGPWHSLQGCHHIPKLHTLPSGTIDDVAEAQGRLLREQGQPLVLLEKHLSTISHHI